MTNDDAHRFECPICETTSLVEDRIAYHLWRDHRDEIEAVFEREQEGDR